MQRRRTGNDVRLRSVNGLPQVLRSIGEVDTDGEVAGEGESRVAGNADLEGRKGKRSVDGFGGKRQCRRCTRCTNLRVREDRADGKRSKAEEERIRSL